MGAFQSLTKMLDIHAHIDNKPLNQVTFAKYLGMFIFNSNLKTDDHIKKLVPKMLPKIDIIRTPSILLNNCI